MGTAARASTEVAVTDEEKRAARVWSAAVKLPDPLLWGPAAEIGRHLKDVEKLPWAARVWCFHTKKPMQLLAVVLRDGMLITDDYVEIALESATAPVTARCPLCSPARSAWRIDPGQLRAVVESGRGLAKIRIEQVAERRLRAGASET